MHLNIFPSGKVKETLDSLAQRDQRLMSLSQSFCYTTHTSQNNPSLQIKNESKRQGITHILHEVRKGIINAVVESSRLHKQICRI